MDQFLRGQKALVTGGTRGIGLEIARALLAAGADVAICGRDDRSIDSALRELKNTRDGGKVVGRNADVSNSEAVAALFKFVDQEFSGLDILVNNAGSGVFRAAAEI